MPDIDDDEVFYQTEYKRRANDSLELKRLTEKEQQEDGLHEMVKAIYKDVQVMKQELGRMHEMFAVWKNAKGFITTITWIGKALYWIFIIVGMITAGWYAFKKIINGV